jgi:hypothetical protein
VEVKAAGQLACNLNFLREKRGLCLVSLKKPLSQREFEKLTLADTGPYELLALCLEHLTPLKKDMSLSPSYQGVTKRCRLSGADL